MEPTSRIREARQKFHRDLLDSVLIIDAKGIPSNADKHNKASVKIAQSIAEQIGGAGVAERMSGQTSGNKFEDICSGFVNETFHQLRHLRPGSWEISQVKSRDSLAIAKFEQYAHLIELDEAAKKDHALAAVLGNDYTISPDVVVVRNPEPDEVINRDQQIVDASVCRFAGLRKANNAQSFLHASISCKWTIRSDRAQNARSEALNLIRNRKGRLPHIVIVTAEPTPSRLSSLALGTGDIDCVYHMALPELRMAVNQLNQSEAEDLLSIMIEGKRLKDISDLPLDLAI